MTMINEAAKLREHITVTAERIARDPDLHHDAKHRKLDELWAEYQPKLADLSEKYEAAEQDRRARVNRSLYSLGSTDPARQAGYRQALDRAAAAASASQNALIALLETAELSGDEDQALAVFTVAGQYGFNQAEEAYLRDRPAKRSALTAYVSEVRGGPLDIEVAWAFSMPPRPTVESAQPSVGRRRGW